MGTTLNLPRIKGSDSDDGVISVEIFRSLICRSLPWYSEKENWFLYTQIWLVASSRISKVAVNVLEGAGIYTATGRLSPVLLLGQLAFRPGNKAEPDFTGKRRSLYRVMQVDLAVESCLVATSVGLTLNCLTGML